MTFLAELLPNAPSSVAAPPDLYHALYPFWTVNLLGTAIAGIFVFRHALRGVSRDLEDAARIDGCGFWRFCWHALLPAVRPALGLLGVFVLVAALDDAMAPAVEAGGNGGLGALRTGLYAFHFPGHGSSIGAGSFGLLMGCSLLVTVAVIAVFSFARRYFLKGGTPPG